MSPFPSPIVVMDSGVGGLTVVKSLRAALPGEKIVYFGDTARVPYGCKTKSTVAGFVQQIISYLLPLRPKHVVIACNTATALALPSIKTHFPGLAITGVIEPGARAAAEAGGRKPAPLISVIATEATVRSGAYESAIYRRRNKARVLILPTPLLAPIIEEGRDESDPLVQLALQQYLLPLIEHRPDVLVLGCTHYPIFKNSISRLMGGKCRVIDSADQCAQDVARRLRNSGLLNAASLNDRWLRCLVTDDSPKFQSLAERFLGTRIDEPIWVPLDKLTAETPAPMPLRQAG